MKIDGKPKNHLLLTLPDLKDMLSKFEDNEHRASPYTCVIIHPGPQVGEKVHWSWTMGEAI